MNMKWGRISAVLLGSVPVLLVAACGGGNGGGATAPGGMNLPVASLIVDVNGDGKNDFVMADGNTYDGFASPAVYINDGNGTSFTLKANAIPPQFQGTNGSAVDIESGDFNKDGKVDLLAIVVNVSYTASQIQLWLGNGDGTFIDATTNISNGFWPGNAACNVAGNPWPSYLRVADIDGDGNLDFVTAFGGAGVCGGVVYRNDGTGKFAPANISITSGGVTYTSTNLGATEVLAGDLNNDGKIDLSAPTVSGTLNAYLNTSTPGAVSFTAVQSTVSPVLQGVLLDINGDGFLDMVGSLAYSYPNYSTLEPVVAFLGNGAGGFTVNNTVLSPQPGVLLARQFLAADVNGDGKKDLLIADTGPDYSPFPGERNWLMINNGSGILVDQTATSLDLLSAYTHQAAIGDLNGDGKPEIILNNPFCAGQLSMPGCVNESRFWMNKGNGAFTAYSPTLH